MDFDFDFLETVIEDRVLYVTIAAPPINVITLELLREIRDLANELEVATKDLSVVVFRSADPDFFLAHFDIEALQAIPMVESSEVEVVNRPSGFQRICEQFRQMGVISIAEIDGRVGGGGAELAASFDMRFGSREKMVLSQMEVPLGLIPGGSGTQRIPRLVGRGRAMEIVCGGVDIDAQTAAEWGWLNRALPSAMLGDYVDRLAGRIATFPPHAVRAGKASVLAAGGDPTEGLIVERQIFDETMNQSATRQRLQTFMDRGGQTRESELKIEQLTADLVDS